MSEYPYNFINCIMDKQQTLDIISQLLTDLNANKKVIELELVVAKLTEENQFLKSKLNKINYLSNPNKLLNACDYEATLRKIFINGNYDELFKYTNFSLEYMNPQMYDFIDSNNISAIKHYIDHYENLEYINSCGRRLIHYFSRSSNSEAILYLINKGVKLDVKNGFDNYPIEFACESGSFEVIQAIMSKGIKLNIRCLDYIKQNRRLTPEEKTTLINII